MQGWAHAHFRPQQTVNETDCISSPWPGYLLTLRLDKEMFLSCRGFWRRVRPTLSVGSNDEAVPGQVRNGVPEADLGRAQEESQRNCQQGQLDQHQEYAARAVQ